MKLLMMKVTKLWEPVCHKAKWQRLCVLRNCSQHLAYTGLPTYIPDGQPCGRGDMGSQHSTFSGPSWVSHLPVRPHQDLQGLRNSIISWRRRKSHFFIPCCTLTISRKHGWIKISFACNPSLILFPGGAVQQFLRVQWFLHLRMIFLHVIVKNISSAIVYAIFLTATANNIFQRKCSRMLTVLYICLGPWGGK